MKKRLLFVNDEMVMGGVARILNNVLRRIDLNEYDVDVLILHPHGELLSELPEGVRLLDARPFFRGVDVTLSLALKQKRWLDVLHKLHVLFYMKTGLIHRKIKAERKHLNLGVYDVEIASKEGFCTIFVANGSSKRKINWIHIDYSARNYATHHMKLMHTALKFIDLNIAVSQKARDAFADLFQVKNIIAIPNLMDIDGLKEKALMDCDVSYRKDRVNLVSVGRFHPQKAFDRLIHAMAELKALDLPVDLYLVGDGELRPGCEALSQKLQLSECIHFLGSKRNPMPYIKQADCFVLPSLYEGYPTTVIESFFAGTPVLACDVSGVYEQIQEGYNGWVVSNSQEALNERLIEVVRNPERLKPMREHLRDYQYDNASIFERFMKAVEGQV